MARNTLTVGLTLLAASFLLEGARADECFNTVLGEIKVPSRLKEIPKEAHVVASVMTGRGALELRAETEAGGHSRTAFYLGGKALRPVAEKDLRKETLSCSRKRTRMSWGEHLGTAFASFGAMVVSEAEARYISDYHCNGSGTVTIKLVECWRTSTESLCSYRFSQRGRTCGWAIMGSPI